MSKNKYKGRHRPGDDKILLAELKKRLHTECFTDDDCVTEEIWRNFHAQPSSTAAR